MSQDGSDFLKEAVKSCFLDPANQHNYTELTYSSPRHLSESWDHPQQLKLHKYCK